MVDSPPRRAEGDVTRERGSAQEALSDTSVHRRGDDDRGGGFDLGECERVLIERT